MDLRKEIQVTLNSCEPNENRVDKLILLFEKFLEYKKDFKTTKDKNLNPLNLVYDIYKNHLQTSVTKDIVLKFEAYSKNDGIASYSLQHGLCSFEFNIISKRDSYLQEERIVDLIDNDVEYLLISQYSPLGTRILHKELYNVNK